MKFSLGMMLALCLAGLQFVAVSIVVFSSFVTSEKVLLEHARELLSDVGTNTIEHSKGFLKPARGAVELATRLAENQVVAKDDAQQLEKLLFQQLQISPQFAGLFYGDESGNFVYVMRSDVGPSPFRTKIVMREGEDHRTELIWRDQDYAVVDRYDDPTDKYDPRSRPWYTSAKDNMASIWTDPYIFFTSKTAGITAASPVYDQGRMRGVVGVDIGIEAISDFLSRLEIGQNGSALILNRNGDVIAHPEQGIIRKRTEAGTFRFVNIHEIADPVANAAFEDLMVDDVVSVEEEQVKSFQLNGARYVSTVMPIISDELPWTIAVYAPETDFTGDIRTNRTQNIWIALGISLASGVLGLWLANYINKPVRAFAVRSALVSQGEIPAAAPMPKTYKELERANETLVNAIAERKKSVEEYGRTFDLASRGMAQIQARTGKMLRVNAKFAEMLGYDVDDLLTRTVHDLSHPDDPVAAVFFAEPAGGRSEYAHEKRYLRKDGSEIWVSENVIVIRDDSAVALHAVVTIDDITARISADREIQQLNLDLTHFARMNMAGHMATGLAHELNQPLLAISQNMDTAKFMLRDLQGGPNDLGQILDETDRHAHRAGDIIKALRGFIKRGSVEKSMFDFVELLEQSLHLVRPEAKAHGIIINTEVDEIDGVYGSRVQIAQVLANLLRNAIEAVAENERGARLIMLRARHNGSGIEVSVTDTGTGFGDDVDLFEQFRTTKREGMGLGLSICRTIVESHSGKIWYQRDENGHSQFCFFLPDTRPKAEVKTGVRANG